MRKIAYYLCVTFLLTFCVLIMNGGDYLKKQHSQTDDVVLHFDRLGSNLKSEDWDKAAADYQNLKTAWQQITPRIQYSVEKDEMNAINVNLARIGAYIDLQEDDDAFAELSEAREHWNNLNR